MALVNYSSDSDSDSDSQKTESNIESNTIEERNSIKSVLPTPKRSGSVLDSLPPPKRLAGSSDKRNILLEVPKLPQKDVKDDVSDATRNSKSDIFKPKNSISSFLPAPKNRKVNTSSSGSSNSSMKPNYNVFKKTNTRILGGGIKNTFFDGEIVMPGGDDVDDGAGDNIQHEVPQNFISESIPKIKKSSLVLVPASVAARNAKKASEKEKNGVKEKVLQAVGIETKPTEPTTKSEAKSETKSNTSLNLPSLFSFHTGESTSSANTSHEYKPLLLETVEQNENIQEVENTNDVNPPANSEIHKIHQFESRHERNKRGEPINIVDFKVDDFYEENERLRAAGELEEAARPVGSISGGKHQLSSLIRNAKQNQEKLEERYSLAKTNKMERGKKYGFS